MCAKAPTPPPPQAPPAPTPVRDTKMDSFRSMIGRQRRAAAGTTAESTMLSGGGSGGEAVPAPVASPVLGG